MRTTAPELSRRRPAVEPTLVCFLVAVIVLGVGPRPARAASGGPDAAGYTWIDFLDGCPVDDEAWGPGVAEHLDLPLTAVVGPVDLGFAMPFHGELVTQAWVSPYGYLTFSAGQPSVPTPQVLPEPAGPNHLLAAHWTPEPIQQVAIRHEAVADAVHVEWEMFLGTAWIRANTDLWLFADGSFRILWSSVNDRFPVLVGHEDRTGTIGNTLIYRTAGGGFGARDGAFPDPRRGVSACIDVPDPPPTLDCAAAQPLPCGTSTGASPASVTANVEYYACGAERWAGRERTYRFELPDVADVAVTLDAGGRDMAVFLLSDCNEWRCLDGGDLDAVAASLAPGTYHVVVDAAAGHEGAFTLTVDCTSLSEPVGCEDSLAGTTAGGTTLLDDSPCLAGDFSGREALTTLDFAPPGNIVATVDSASGLSAFILSGSGPLDPGQCLAAGVGGAIAYGPPAGRYTIVVDGPPGSEGTYTLSTACEPQVSCTAGALDCDASRRDTTVGRLPLVDFYSCSTLAYPGPEAVFELEVAARQVVSFVLDDSADPRLDLFLLDACDEGACIAAGDDQISVELEAGTYQVVVDGREAAAAPFELTTICGNTLSPDLVQVAAVAGECFTEHKTARLTPFIVQADVLFAIDLTGSMGGARDQLQRNMADIVERLSAFVRDLAFGLARHHDYNFSGAFASPCPYSGGFGSRGDLPYVLEQPLTTDEATMLAAVQRLPAVSGGGDNPESYARLLLEAAEDPAIGWRPGSRRILVTFGDELPHDCNVLECLGGVATTERGIDLGRDELPETGDEIAILDAVQALADARITLLHLDNSGGTPHEQGFSYREIWECWAGLTGGVAEALQADGTVPSGIDLAQLVGQLVSDQGSRCDVLQLVASAGYEDWLVSSSPVLADARLPGVFEFDIEICVPAGTPVGTHSFEVQALCSDGVAAVQQVEVEVVDDCQASVVGPPGDEHLCLGESVTLDASGLRITDCPGVVQREWRVGAEVVGTGPTLTVSPTETTTYDASVTCSTDPSCAATASVTVTVDEPPLLATVSARDPAECNAGIELTWDEATFFGPGGTGAYNVYRSETGCADALSRAPVALGLVETRWVDSRTRGDRTYHYVVEAEDSRSPSACLPQGPANGGAVARACAPPVTERADPTTPEGVGATLRVAHAGASVTVDWSLSRALLPGEHYHLKKALELPTAPFQLLNGEGDRSRALTEVDETARLQLFDLRVANACEVESADEFPPDRSGP